MDEYVCVINPNLTYRPVERIVRCRDCAKSELRGRRLYCKAPMGHVGYAEVCEDDFCSCGEPREVGV